jgi:hypothetical protein
MPVVVVTLNLHHESKEHRKKEARACKDDENLDEFQQERTFDDVTKPRLILEEHAIIRRFNLILLFGLLLLLPGYLSLDAPGHSALVHVEVVHNVQVLEASLQSHNFEDVQ